MKILVVVPVYNEQDQVLPLLRALQEKAWGILVVDDGSTDRSPQDIASWARDCTLPFATVLTAIRNEGKARALRRAFLHASRLVDGGILDPDDVVALVDADGQHDVRDLEPACAWYAERDLDVLIGQRDFSVYPPYKVLGNVILTAQARVLTGRRFTDTQCGFRCMRVRAVLEVLPWYEASRYACEQELTIISSLLGHRMDNSFRLRPTFYRSNTTLQDAFHIFATAFKAWWRCRRAAPAPRPAPSPPAPLPVSAKP